MATEDKGSVPSEKKTGMPKRKSKWPNTPAKWIALLGTPLTILLATGGLFWQVIQFNAQQSANVQMQATQVAVSDHMQATQVAATQAQALDQQRQAVLDTYFKDMSDLIFTDGLATSKPGSEVRAIAEARTYTAVSDLDGKRKAILVGFLRNAQLIKGPHPIIDLHSANLSGAIFGKGDNLVGADLSGSDLRNADLSSAVLCGAGMNGKKVCADLRDADLSGAIFGNGAPLEDADLSGAILACVDLGGGKKVCADLSGAHLEGVHLSGAYLYGADLSSAILCRAGLNGKKVCADLSGAHLDGANMNNILPDLRGTLLRGARYNTKPWPITDTLGGYVTLEPTLWPLGFDPKVAGAKCSDC